MVAIISFGSVLGLLSVGVSIYRRRNAIPRGPAVSLEMTVAEQRDCFDDLEDVTLGLKKHLENTHHLLGGYDPDLVQRWSDEGAVWRKQWVLLGNRCRFPEIRKTPMRKELEAMAVAYDELGETDTIYGREILRFGKEQAPRLDRIRERINKIGARLNDPGQPTEVPAP